MAKLTQQEELARKQGNLLKELTECKGWQEVLRPWLEDKIQHSWVDPRQVQSDQELAFRYKTAWAWADAANGILQFIDKMIEESVYYTKKEKDEIKNPLREGIS
jgi:hypothetical protein